VINEHIMSSNMPNRSALRTPLYMC